MRRNITLSLDDEFIRRMDEERGEMPRSRWIESGRLAGPVFPPDPDEPPSRVAERSPVPPAKVEPPREARPLPTARRHSPTCSCGVCKPPKS